MHYLNYILWTFSLFLTAFCLGCMPTICKEHENNVILECEGDICGFFGGLRHNGEMAQGVDITCNEGSVVVAPFDGNLSYWRPFGRSGKREEEGVKISGFGQWQGYKVYIAPLLLDFFSGSVKKGQRIGKSRNYGAVFNVTTVPHLRLYLLREKKFIDPTYHLTDCMCTGQICETNIHNTLIGKPFHHENSYNGVFGWNIKCPMDPKKDTDKEASPKIYSPLDAKWIGRLHWYGNTDDYNECDNDGLVLLGTNKWEGFEVRLYNVIYKEGYIGKRNISQGETIGTRLNCDSSPDTIFMEVRYRGKVVDVSDLISANLCKKPRFMN